MSIIIINTKTNLSQYPNAILIDMTTIDEKNAFSKLSPYYPHGEIPIPNTHNLCLNSVNEVWQKLCVKSQDNLSRLEYKNLKFRKGLKINEYWTYTEARREIFIPLYCWMLENKAFKIIEFLRKQLLTTTIVIVDKSINCNIDNIEEPLSCAFLLKAYIKGTEPYQNAIKEVIESHYIIGRKEICFPKRKLVPQKIAYIYTGSQRIIDFKVENIN